MKLEGRQQRLTIYIGESDRHGHTPLATEIVQRAHAAGLAGASVFRGVEGYGASNHIHTTRILSLSDDLPMAIVIVDSHDAIAAFLPELDELITEGLVVVEDIDVVKYVGTRTTHHEPLAWIAFLVAAARRRPRPLPGRRPGARPHRGACSRGAPSSST